MKHFGLIAEEDLAKLLGKEKAMKSPTDRQKEARDIRELARRARLMAEWLSEPDCSRIKRCADELDQEAAGLERQAQR